MTLSLVDLLAPEFLHEEIQRHQPLLRRRAGLSERGAAELLDLLEGYLTMLPAEALLPHWKQAEDAMGPIDPRDVPYVAAALAAQSDGVWSDDPHLKAQRVVSCWTTTELVGALRAQGLKF
jgi:predicted nucleic acid-binding protein